MTLRESVFGIALVVSVTGCVSPRTSFIATDASVALAPRETPPELFVDRKPTAPYRSMGLLEVASSGSPKDVVSHAQARAAQLGCELVVDHALHASSATSPESASLESPLRERRDAEAQTRVGTPDLLGQHLAPVRTTVTAPAQREKRVFVCGMYESTRARWSAAQTARMEAGAAAQAVWQGWVAAREGSACDDALALLREEARCTGSACLGALMLSSGFQSNCGPKPATRVEVHRLRKQWGKTSSSATSPCLQEVSRAASDPTMAATLAPTCEGQSKTDAALRDALRKSTPPPPRSEQGVAAPSSRMAKHARAPRGEATIPVQ